MIRLIRLELKKIHIKNYIMAVALSFLATMLFISTALHDSGESTDDFASAFRVIEMIFAFVFIILFSVLNGAMIISEYNNKTILILFTYPIERKKVIYAKLVLITSFVAVSMTAGYLLCGAFIVGADHFFNWIEGDFRLPILYDWIQRALSTIIVFCNLGLWTFAVGMWKRSVSMAIVSSVLFIFIRQIAVASTKDYQDNIFFIITVTIITVFSMKHTFARRITQID